jgi:hypothetical protein
MLAASLRELFIRSYMLTAVPLVAVLAHASPLLSRQGAPDRSSQFAKMVEPPTACADKCGAFRKSWDQCSRSYPYGGSEEASPYGCHYLCDASSKECLTCSASANHFSGDDVWAYGVYWLAISRNCAHNPNATGWAAQSDEVYGAGMNKPAGVEEAYKAHFIPTPDHMTTNAADPSTSGTTSAAP